MAASLKLVAGQEIKAPATLHTMHWFRGRELVGLPGLPDTDRNVRARAIREGWQSRERTGRGGGREYHISNLPDRARAALLLRLRAKSATPEQIRRSPEEKRWAEFEQKPARVREEAIRRVKVMTALELLFADGMKKTSAYAAVAFE